MVNLRSPLSLFSPHKRMSGVRWKVILLSLLCLVLLELVVHIQSFTVIRPPTDLDPPFYTGCQDPVRNTSVRENAALVMLARNSDIVGAVSSVRSVQTQFNHHFQYPWIFLNDESWSNDFIQQVKNAGEGTNMQFETIPSGMWGYPAWIDQPRARTKMNRMRDQGVLYAGTESYHHMCRFQSG
jgi:mannosyltransferase